jgi:hypothetical protein
MTRLIQNAQERRLKVARLLDLQEPPRSGIRKVSKEGRSWLSDGDHVSQDVQSPCQVDNVLRIQPTRRVDAVSEDDEQRPAGCYGLADDQAQVYRVNK